MSNFWKNILCANKSALEIELERKRNSFRLPVDGQDGEVRYINGVKYYYEGPADFEDYGRWYRADGLDVDGWDFSPGV